MVSYTIVLKKTICIISSENLILDNSTELHCEKEYFGFAENTRTCRLQASLTRLRGVCEADS